LSNAKWRAGGRDDPGVLENGALGRSAPRLLRFGPGRRARLRAVEAKQPREFAGVDLRICETQGFALRNAMPRPGIMVTAIAVMGQTARDGLTQN
jgi:hypothetical protein